MGWAGGGWVVGGTLGGFLHQCQCSCVELLTAHRPPACIDAPHLAAGGAPDEGAWGVAAQDWAAAAGQLDMAAGIAAGAAPPKPLLWKRGGRPLLPRSLALSEALAQLLALCDASK